MVYGMCLLAGSISHMLSWFQTLRPGAITKCGIGGKHGKAGKDGAVYKISVTTADRKNAGTEARVYLLVTLQFLNLRVDKNSWSNKTWVESVQFKDKDT